MVLSKQEKSFWRNNKYIKLNKYLSAHEKSCISFWCDDMQTWSETPGKWMQYFEKTNNSLRQLCRIENFLYYHFGLNHLATGAKAIDLISELMEEEASIFKEKINFKFPGANGFAPHQDYPAFISFKQTYHITMMIAIDDCTLLNGCLQVSPLGEDKQQILDYNSDMTIANSIAKKLQWLPIECKRGEILLFDSYLPHYSGVNNTNKARRALFFTYNKMSDGGYMHEKYYQDKREKFPQECERQNGIDYSKGAQIYNIANPIINKVI